MKLNFFAILAMCVSSVSIAQTDPKVFTLRQCIDYALTNNTLVKNATLDEYISKYKVQEFLGTGLPQASANFSAQHSDPLRRMFLQNTPGSAFSSYFGNAPYGTVVAIPNLFQLKNTADASVTVNQILFSNSFFVGLKAAKTFALLATANKEFSKIQVIENVSKAYYLTVINAERRNLFDVNISRVDSLLKQSRSMYNSGFAEKIDVDRLEVTYNNLLTEKIKSDNMMLISVILLKYQMNMPLDQEFGVFDNIQNIVLDSTITGGADYGNRIEYRQLQTQMQLDKLNYKLNQQGYLPTANLSANLGVFNQSPEFDYLTKGHAFYNYGTYSFNVSMPLFTGLGRVKRTQQARLNYEKTQNNLERFKSTAAMQTSTSEIAYKNSLQALSVQKRNAELAKEVARVTRIKFTSGTGPNIEVVTAEASLKEAQINYYSALYDALVARVDYDKALGNLK